MTFGGYREIDAERFGRSGVAFPFTALSPEEAAECLARIEAMEAARAGRLPPLLNFKPHLLVPWLWDLVHDERVVAPVRRALGPDVLCWASSFFDKGPGEPHHVPWHQDATYWGLTAPDALTAWIAFTPSTRTSGCLRVVPGSHARQLAHGPSPSAHNLLAGGEEILVEVDEAQAVDVELAPGEMSLHHLLLIHGSEPNRSQGRRLGFAIRYIDGRLSQSGGNRGSATLVSGRDHGGFDLEQRPEGELAPEAVARHSKILRRWMGIVYPEVKRSQDAAR
jgi:hypothetical protein